MGLEKFRCGLICAVRSQKQQCIGTKAGKNYPRYTLDLMRYFENRGQKPGNFIIIRASTGTSLKVCARGLPLSSHFVALTMNAPNRERLCSIPTFKLREILRGAVRIPRTGRSRRTRGSLPAGSRGGSSPPNREVCHFSGASYQTADVSLSIRVRAANAGTSHNRNAHLWSLSQGQPRISRVASVKGGPGERAGEPGVPSNAGSARLPPHPPPRAPSTPFCPGVPPATLPRPDLCNSLRVRGSRAPSPTPPLPTASAETICFGPIHTQTASPNSLPPP